MDSRLYSQCESLRKTFDGSLGGNRFTWNFEVGSNRVEAIELKATLSLEASESYRLNVSKVSLKFRV